MKDDETLQKLRLVLEIGRSKNPYKNLVAEKAVAELEEEILRQTPGGEPVSKLDLAISVARLNSHIRYSGLSSREMWTQRSQFTNEQLPVSDGDNITKQNDAGSTNHSYSEKSKFNGAFSQKLANISVGDIVYLNSECDKSHASNRYLVVIVDGEWCFIKKFIGNQLGLSSYKVKLSECFKVPTTIPLTGQSVPAVMKHYPEPPNEDPTGDQSMSLLEYKDSFSDTPPSEEYVSSQSISDSNSLEINSVPTNPTSITDIPDTPDELSGTTRPTRTRRSPKYLEDYAL